MLFSRRQLIGVAMAAAMTPGLALASEKISVVATTGMIADAAREIGGDLADVKALMGPGIDPHAYRQTRSDVVALAKADLVLWNGLYLEAQLEDLLGQIASRTHVVPVAEALPTEARIAHDDYADRFDPHIWMDPDMWQSALSAMVTAFQTIDPENAAAYAENGARYAMQVEEMGAYATKVLATVPEDSRVLLTAHDAFNYFGSAYGFDVIGIQGISTESEAGLVRIRELVDMLVDRDIRAVFVESSVNDRSVRALIEGARAAGHDVQIGGELFSDAMGQLGTYEGTYLGMIDHNATVITRALGGRAPEQGAIGRLAAGS